MYEDAFLTVCCKPVGVVSEADHGKGMPELLSSQYEAAGKPSYIAGVHRLDKQVGGLMLFSRKKSFTGKLTGLISQREVKKEYLAVVWGIPKEPEGVLKDLLYHDPKTNKTFPVTRMRRGVREASLAYRVLETKEDISLVGVTLHTGRTHQIRVQFASRGLPLVGDVRYGSPNCHCDPALWSHCLQFPHPATGQTLSILCPPPDCFPWNQFSIKK